MRVLCINNSSEEKNAMLYRLTINKWYEVQSTIIDSIDKTDIYWIKNDIDGVSPYPSKLFLTVKEYRKLKLNKINELSRKMIIV